MTNIEDVLDKAVEEICSDGIVSLMDKIIDYKFKGGRRNRDGAVDACFIFFGERVVIHCMGIRFSLNVVIECDHSYIYEGGGRVLGLGLTKKLNESNFPNIVRDFKKTISL